jgi:hypothetical protein
VTAIVDWRILIAECQMICKVSGIPDLDLHSPIVIR